MSPRLYIESPLQADTVLALPPASVRHVQVLRLQPGAELILFDGQGGEFAATVGRIGRGEVEVTVGARREVDRELARPVSLAIVMPANDRMDALVEKATELGVARIVPLMSERSVLRLQGERAAKKLAHWRGVAVAACEQCGRTRLPALGEVQSLGPWLQGLPEGAGSGRWLLCLGEGQPLASAADRIGTSAPVLVLSGPEGGLSTDEEALALRCGFATVTLGPRVLRADTAPLAALAALALRPA